jgi:hypothetical protein
MVEVRRIVVQHEADVPHHPVRFEFERNLRYEVSSPEKICEHAMRSDMPAAEIFEVVDTVVIRPDPVAAAA